MWSHAEPAYARTMQDLLNAIATGEEEAYQADPSKKKWNNDWNRTHLREGSIDFYQADDRTWTHEIDLIGITGGTHLGTLYITRPLSGTVHRLDCGPIYSILNMANLSLFGKGDGPEELFVLTSTGGTGMHEVFGMLIQLEGDKARVLFTVPLTGHTPFYLNDKAGVGRGGTFEYEVVGQTFSKKGLTLHMMYHTRFPEDASPKEKASVLKRHQLKSADEPFTITIHKDRSLTVEAASEGIKNGPQDTITDLLKAPDWARIETFKIPPAQAVD